MKAVTHWIRHHVILSSGFFLILLLVASFAYNSCKTSKGFGRFYSSVNRESDTLSDPIKRGSIVESVYGIGTVTAKNSYQLKLGVTSTVRRLFVAEGDTVTKGKKLIDFEGTETFNAPFDGIITYLSVKPGETVFAQGIILKLVDLIDRYVVVSLEQRAAVRVRQGQRAKLNFENMREETFNGIVQSIYSHDSNFLVRIGVDSLPQQILPAMTADTTIAVGEHKDVLVIPTLAIDAGRVFVSDKNARPKAIEVKTGLVDGTMAEVLSGDLREGDRLYLRKQAAK